MIGKTVSHYEILEKLGEGGMGVVYKAHDTKLDRQVALKFLPPHLYASEPDKARFLQEAKAAASLNHPNICVIHSIEESDGQLFIVMDFVDGQTLNLKRGTISFKQSVDIGVQIADGLAAAHEKGIVHRDIKPENIMVRKDGIVQIMDFGLAKLRGVSRLTKEGSTVGTAGYMAPEQIQGHDVDHRSDIFSLGVVLYELFSGQLPFKGMHETALSYEIVNVDAQPMSSVKPDIDPALDAIVMECLEKDPNERTQSARQISVDLARVRRGSSKERVSRTMPSRPAMKMDTMDGPKTSGVPKSWKSIFWPILSGALAVALVLVWSPWRRDATMLPPVIHFAINTHLSGSILNGGSSLTISPDGRLVAYYTGKVGEEQLFVRPIDQLEARVIPGTERSSDAFFSPDGQWIALPGIGKLRKVSIFGGAPQDICDAPSLIRGGCWGPDNMITFGLINKGLFRVSASGGIAEPFTVLDSTHGEISHRFPALLPDGKTVVFTVKTSNIASFDEATIAAQRIGSTEKKILLQGGTYARYILTGHLMFARGGSLFAVPFDAATVEVKGPPVAALEGGLLNQLSGAAHFACSNTGILVYSPANPLRFNTHSIVWMDRRGNLQPLLPDPRPFAQVSLSPDGQKLAVAIQAANDDIWVYHIGRRVLTRLTFGGGNHGNPIWTPDSKKVIYSAEKGSSAKLCAKAWDGSGVEEELMASVNARIPNACTPDGKILSYSERGDLWIVPLDGQLKPSPLIQTPASEGQGEFSPDGRWFAYTSDQSGRLEVYVVPFPKGDGKWQVSSGGGYKPSWSPDGKRLFFLQDEKIMVADVSLKSAFDFSTAKQVGTIPAQAYDFFGLSADGEKFIIGMSQESRLEMNDVNVIVGWFDELKEKFGAKR